MRLVEVLGRDVLLIDRFDRSPYTGQRRLVVSALTILGLDEMYGRYATYYDLADVIRERFRDAEVTLRELFARITFNILVGNTEDHARNHSAFWDGHELSLTPAYDICPQNRAGGEAAQAMAIGRDGFRKSQLAGCVGPANLHLLSEAEAREIIDRQVTVIEADWPEVSEAARMTEADRAYFWRRQFLNLYAFEGY